MADTDSSQYILRGEISENVSQVFFCNGNAVVLCDPEYKALSPVFPVFNTNQ